MNPDDVFDRLRAADPAAGSEPDLVAIRAGVTAATGVPLAAVAPAGTAAAAHDELAPRRRARNDWVRMAAAVAAVAVVGTGGFLASGLSGSSSTPDARAVAGPALLPAISLRGGQARDATPSSSGADVAAGGSTGSGIVGGFWGRTEFAGSGLSTAGGTATAYAYDASGVATAQTAARIAAVLGVTRLA